MRLCSVGGMLFVGFIFEAPSVSFIARDGSVVGVTLDHEGMVLLLDVLSEECGALQDLDLNGMNFLLKPTDRLFQFVFNYTLEAVNESGSFELLVLADEVIEIIKKTIKIPILFPCGYIHYDAEDKESFLKN